LILLFSVGLFSREEAQEAQKEQTRRGFKLELFFTFCAFCAFLRPNSPRLPSPLCRAVPVRVIPSQAEYATMQGALRVRNIEENVHV
jgi:hypothetical protein